MRCKPGPNQELNCNIFTLGTSPQWTPLRTWQNLANQTVFRRFSMRGNALRQLFRMCSFPSKIRLYDGGLAKGLPPEWISNSSVGCSSHPGRAPSARVLPTLGLELRSSGEAYRHRRSGSAGRISSIEWSRNQRVVTGGRPPRRVGPVIVSGNRIRDRVFLSY